MRANDEMFQEILSGRGGLEDGVDSFDVGRIRIFGGGKSDSWSGLC